jgi:phospholipase C
VNRRGPAAVIALATIAFGLLSHGQAASAATPIQHIVILFQENHSFDDVFGRFCADVKRGRIVRDGANMKCDGAVRGTTATGETIRLKTAPDVVPEVSHSVESQQKAMDGGLMDGFSLILGCRDEENLRCYETFDPAAIPNLATLAEHFALSDRTFELRSTPSWGGHLILAAATLDGFSGDNPKRSSFTEKQGPGWGCDSFRDAPWWDGSQWVPEPSCIPDQSGRGPYRSSPVRYVPTIFDRLDTAGLTWRLYTTGVGPATKPVGGPYGWEICPSFYECLGGPQHKNLKPTPQVIADASAGHLPSFSIVTPPLHVSQHNGYSMAVGDNYIGKIVSAVEAGPDWDSTALFIVYDDCGCFYDHVNPLRYDPNWGIRVPVVMVSPYAQAGFTDSTPATLASFLAYTEQTFGLPPLAEADADAYGFSRAFDYSQRPLEPVRMGHTHVPAWERRLIARRPVDEDDPT